MAKQNKQDAFRVLENAEMEWVPVDAFSVDHSYDRDPIQTHIDFLTRNWDQDIMGPLLASRRANGKHYLLDGQHRIGALKKLGKGKYLVPALVYEGLSVADEARIYRKYNKDRRQPSPSDNFRALVREGDPKAVAIKKVLDDLDLELNSFGNTQRDVKCVANVIAIYNKMGAAGLDATLSTVNCPGRRTSPEDSTRASCSALPASSTTEQGVSTRVISSAHSPHNHRKSCSTVARRSRVQLVSLSTRSSAKT